MNKNLVKLIVMLATFALASCGGSSCSTKEDVKAKGEELTKKMQSLIASGDMSKIMALSGKMKEIQKLGSSSDPQDACDAMDELMEDM